MSNQRRLMRNSQSLIPLLVFAGMAMAAGTSLGQVELYVKKDSLPETLLAAQARLQQWRAAQSEARSVVKLESSHRAGLTAARR